MASATVAGPWPDGTNVSAYGQGNEVPGAPPKAAPAAVTTAVASGGQVTFTGLADGTDYVAYAPVGGVDRYVEFRTPLPATGPQRVGTHAQRLAAGHVSGRFWKETDTGLIYLDDGVNWLIWKAEGVVRKSTTETIPSPGSTTLQDDDELRFPIEANEVWFAEAFLMLNSVSATPDVKIAWTIPSGTWKGQSGGNVSGTGVGSSPNVITAGSSSVGSAAGDYMSVAAAWFMNGAAAGFATLQWAQSTLTAEDLKVLANAFLRIKRLA